MKLAIVVSQINRNTYSVCWLTRIQLLAFISSSVPDAMWKFRVSVVSVKLHIHEPPWFYLWFLCCLCWFIDELETSTWAIQIHVLESHQKWGLGLNPRKVSLNPLVTHYWPFQVDTLLWLLAVQWYHLIVLFKLHIQLCLNSESPPVWKIAANSVHYVSFVYSYQSRCGSFTLWFYGQGLESYCIRSWHCFAKFPSK